MTSEAHIEVVPTLRAGSQSRSDATRDLTNLDLLRAVAVGLVFAGHLMDTAGIRGLGDLGHFGVLLFFVHTAFVLMLSMGRFGLSGSSLYRAFFTRRIFRIYPLSVLAVILVIAFSIPSTSWGGGYVAPGLPDLLSNIFLTQNITHSGSVICVLWSLPFEIQMYASLPGIYLLMLRFSSVGTTWVVWLAGVSLAGVEYMIRSGTCAPEYLLARYVPCFLAGILAWRLTTTQRQRAPGWLWILLLGILAAAYRMVDAFRVYGPAFYGALHGKLRYDHGVWWPPFIDLVNDWVFCGITGLAIPHFANITNRWLNVISKRIAQYSYGIYICHVPLLWLCFKRFHVGSVAMSSVLSIVLTGLVSILLYYWLEDPAIRLGKRIATQWEGRTIFA